LNTPPSQAADPSQDTKIKSLLFKNNVPPVLESSYDGENYILVGEAEALRKFPTELNELSPTEKKSLQSIHLKNVLLNSQLFTTSLIGATNLKSIIMDRVQLEDGANFSPTFLPNLQEFYFDQVIGFHEQYKDYENFTTPEKMSSVLFFNTKKGATLSLTDKMLNPGINSVKFLVDGWTVFESTIAASNSSALNKTKGSDWVPTFHKEVTLALPYSSQLLSNNTKDGSITKHVGIDSLTLTECSVAKEDIPKNLFYLNLYRVQLEDSTISELVKDMSNLEILYVENPNATLDLSSVPPSLKFLSFSSMHLIYKEGSSVPITFLACSFVQEIEIVKDFNFVFPLLERVAIFEQKEGYHELLQNLLKTNVSWVYIEGFNRIGNETTIKTEVEQEIETFLDGLKLEVTDRHFLLEKNEDGYWNARTVTKDDRLEYRYKLLGWEKFITVDSYEYYLS